MNEEIKNEIEEVVCVDQIENNGKPFKSDIEYVRKVINDFNYRMTTGREEYIPLSEFFFYIFNYERRIR